MKDYDRIAKAIEYIETNSYEQPMLEEVAEHIGLSPYHFQKLFTRWAGVSPKKFLQYTTLEGAKRLLKESESVLDTAFEVGLSSPSRLHDLFVKVEAVTPGEYKSGGEGIQISYGMHDSPFGHCLLAVTERGVCGLRFIDADPETEISALRKIWKNAVIKENTSETAPYIDRIFTPSNGDCVNVLLKGTEFQLKVWRALLEIPEGSLTTYSRIAEHICTKRASRAVGTASGQNSIGYLIPCHRVLRTTGELGGYRWGLTRKKAIIGFEQG